MKYLEMELRECFARLDRAEQLALVRMARTMATDRIVAAPMGRKPIGFVPGLARVRGMGEGA